MSDRYAQLARSPIGKAVFGNVGLPQPPVLDRFTQGDPVVDGKVLLGAAPGGHVVKAAAAVLAGAGADVATELSDDVRSAAADAGLDASIWNSKVPGDQRFKALVFDASGIRRSDDLFELHGFFNPAIRKLRSSSRMIVIGTSPEHCDNPRHATAQRALEGFVRSLGKESRGGGTTQLVYVEPGAEEQSASTLRFLLSPRSAFVSGQVVRVTSGRAPEQVDWDQPLAGKVALVTGASRGIGEAIATTLARDGAHVIALDMPQMTSELRAVAERIGGSVLEMDVTAATAPDVLGKHLIENHGGLDVMIHNAGITRDKTIAGMPAELWEAVIDVNLSSQERINDELLSEGILREHGRIVCVSSISGIAGNAGQSNYATSKAGVIGMVQSMAPVVGEKGITINAVAPGFIETKMTAQVPFAIREAGRRMNSLSQGGLPSDVAEAIAWYAASGSGGLNGNVVRVCGQALLGA